MEYAVIPKKVYDDVIKYLTECDSQDNESDSCYHLIYAMKTLNGECGMECART
jgi:hypothetical protein